MFLMKLALRVLDEVALCDESGSIFQFFEF